MNDSGRLAVRAAADIALSLLLGADLVLFVVWLANLLGLTPAEVAAVRGALERTAGLADLPWWLWTGLYAALAVAAARSRPGLPDCAGPSGCPPGCAWYQSLTWPGGY